MRVGRDFLKYGLSLALGELEPTSSASSIYTATFCSVAGSVVSASYFALYSASAFLIALFQSALDKPVNLVMIPSLMILKEPHNL